MSNREEMKEKMLSDADGNRWIDKWSEDHIRKGIKNANWTLQNVKMDADGIEKTNLLIEALTDALAARQREPNNDAR